MPLRCMTGAFAVYDGNKISGVLVVHVDDGLWAGAGPAYEKAREYVRQHLNIKTERTGEFDFLGRRIKQLADKTIEVQQWKYVEDIKPIFIPASRRRKPNSLATAEEKTRFKSLIQQMSWPARSSLPGLSFDVSDMRQKSEQLTVGLMVRANNVLRAAKGMVARQVKVRFPAGCDPHSLGVISVHDASFGQQPDHASQQGYMTLVTSSDFNQQGLIFSS